MPRGSQVLARAESVEVQEGQASSEPCSTTQTPDVSLPVTDLMATGTNQSTASTDCTVGVTDYESNSTDPVVAATEKTAGVTNHVTTVTDLEGLESSEGWVCMLCTYLNSETATVCQSCNSERRVGAIDDETTATDHDDQTATTTGQVATATDQATFNDLYFRIYNEYYGPGRVTVGATYTSTKDTWDVARIIDRRTSERGFEYRVLWLVRHRGARRYYQRTWEPKEPLEADGVTEEMDLVDRWKISGVDNFDEYCKTDKHPIAADTQGLCLFNAFKHIAELAGRPGIVSRPDIDDFVAYKRDKFGIDLSQGTFWKIVLEFLRGLRDDGRDFKFKPLSRQNFAISGRRGARVLDEVELFDGLYFCAAYNHSFVDHAFVLQVQGDQRLVFDQDQVMLPQAATWINFLAFVRPFMVYPSR